VAVTDHVERVTAAAAATSIRLPVEFSWFGEASPPLPARVRQALTARTARSYLLHAVQTRLYQDFYLRGVASPTSWDSTGGLPAARAAVIGRLSSANAGDGFWESGWTLVSAGPDEAVVSRDGLQLRVRPEDCPVPLEASPRPGPVRLRMPKEFLNLSPGFYMAAGDRELLPDGSRPLVRVYWNLRVAGAVPFVRAATTALNYAEVPFRLKVLLDAGGFVRCDAGVLYLRGLDDDARDGLTLVYRDVTGHLKAGTPALTQVLHPGVAFAEDPGGGFSFGQHRMRLLADGLIRAAERGQTSLPDRLRTVTERFAEAGVSLQRPFLSPDPALPVFAGAGSAGPGG
jgi:hypothetical protein